MRLTKKCIYQKKNAQVRERPTTHRSNNMHMAPAIATGAAGHMKLSTPAMVSSRFRFRAANSGQSGPFHHGTACQSLQNCCRPQPPERLGVVPTRQRPWDAQTLLRAILLRLLRRLTPPPICYSTTCSASTAKEIRPLANHSSLVSGHFLAEKTYLVGY